jgi:uncharacterized membrane protein
MSTTSATRTGTAPAEGAARVLVAAGILAQVAHPLLSGTALRAATVSSVVLLAGAALAHAWALHGPATAAGLLAGAGGTGLLAEVVGVHTGVPFGDYAYTGVLGVRVLDVPVVVPLAWVLFAYPCLVLARRLVRGPLRRALVGGAALASWDLFLDPMMVAQGGWTWHHPDPGLPGVPGVPLTNFAGWVLVSVVIVAVLERVLPEPGDGPDDEAVPAAVLAWTWAGSVVGNLVFFDRPWVAVWGGVAMGVFVLPYLLGYRRRLGPARAGRAG